MKATVSDPKERFLFIDNLRIFLTIMVILQHAGVPFNEGSWFYSEPFKETALTFALFGLLLSMGSAYLMGFFFTISGYFTPGSYERKSPLQYITDRLLRLGVPLVVFSTVLAPVLNYFCAIVIPGRVAGFGHFYIRIFKEYGVDMGPLWFAGALIIFSLIYALYRQTFSKRNLEKVSGRPLRFYAAMIYAVLISLVTFLVRLGWPMNQWASLFKVFHWEPAHWPQYITMFVLGIMAYRRGWLRNIPKELGKKALVSASVLLGCWGLMMLLGGALQGHLDLYFGGFHWQSLAYSLWENLFAVSLIISLLYLAKKHLNFQSPLVKEMSANAFAVYIFHPVILVAVQYSLREVGLNPFLKFFVTCFIAIPFCFTVASIIRRLPGARRII